VLVFLEIRFLYLRSAKTWRGIRVVYFTLLVYGMLLLVFKLLCPFNPSALPTVYRCYRILIDRIANSGRIVESLLNLELREKTCSPASVIRRKSSLKPLLSLHFDRSIRSPLPGHYRHQETVQVSDVSRRVAQNCGLYCAGEGLYLWGQKLKGSYFQRPDIWGRTTGELERRFGIM
jgi:hypothetical protein